MKTKKSNLKKKPKELSVEKILLFLYIGSDVVQFYCGKRTGRIVRKWGKALKMIK